MPFVQNTPDSLTVVLLVVALLLTYFVGRVAIAAVPARRDGPLLRAVVFSWPSLAIAVLAVVAGRPMLAVHLPIAVSTMALTVGMAFLLLFQPRRVRTEPAFLAQPGETAPRADDGRPRSASSWALLLPAVGLLGISSVAGSIDVPMASALLAFGLLAILSWRREPRPSEIADPVYAELARDFEPASPAVIDATTAPSPGGPARKDRDAGSFGLLLPMALLTAIGAACVISILPGAERAIRLPAEAILILFFLAPSIVLPMVLEGLPPSRRMTWGGTISTLVLFALVNLCFALPAAALAERYAPKYPGLFRTMAAPATQPVAQAVGPDDGAIEPAPGQPPASRPATRPTAPRLGPVALPLAPATAPTAGLRIPANVWRADVLALSAAALLLIPLSIGRFRAGFIEALALAALYFLYLLLSMAYLVMG